jgi:hypothetical protein
MAETFRALWRRACVGAVEKRAPFRTYVRIDKISDEKRLVYGWASIVTKNGRPVVDLQGDVIQVCELEAMAYRFVQHARVGKAQHRVFPGRNAGASLKPEISKWAGDAPASLPRQKCRVLIATEK